MNLKVQITMAAALAVSALTFAGTAAGQDAHERSAGNSGQAAIEYFWANEHATVGQSGLAGHLVDYVDGAQRSEPLTGTPGPAQIEAVDDGGFDWGSAMVGASSALVLALLIGVSLVTVRRFRAGPLAH